jgi:hypothetical protein
MMTYRTAAGVERHLSFDDEMVKYAISRFSGQGYPNRTHWSGKDPPYDTGGWSSPPTEDFEGWVQLKYPARNEPPGAPSPNKTFENYWSALVFEFYNMENGTESANLYDRATKLAIDRETFILQQAALENRADCKAVQFYEERWKPWALAHEFPSNPQLWRIDAPKTFRGYLKWVDGSGYPEVPYGSFYDQQTQWARKRVARPATTQSAKRTP